MNHEHLDRISRGTPRLRLLTALATGLLLVSGTASAEHYVLLGWNDLGMHCANQDFSTLVVLPPYNNVRAQLIRSEAGSLPELITDGVRIDYSIPGNTTSVTKTNFWEYAHVLFDLPAPLTPDIGLTGNGLTGTMAPHDGHFMVTGIPVTPFQDNDLVNEQPYQLIRLEAHRESDNVLLASTEVTIPVSNEIGCLLAGCHSSELDILEEHPDEDEGGFNINERPILCARCHASNALGTPGIPEAKSLSFRLHEKHKDIRPTNGISTCYKCHPGNQAQCLRGVMATGIADPMICQDCHGNMEQISESIDDGRRPWLDEPSCGSCHGAAYGEEPGTLFRESRGHGGLYCSACHGSPHAEWPSGEPNDNLQSISLMGHAGILSQCGVCHATPPTAGGPHGSPAPALAIADLHIDEPVGNHVRLSWSPAANASRYLVYSLEGPDTPPAYWNLLGSPVAPEYLDTFTPAPSSRFYRVVSVNE